MLLRADKIHDGKQWLPEHSVLETDEQGRIIAVHTDEALHDRAHYYEGILCPGFVNAHCHVELSHMKGLIQERTGLQAFLLQVLQQRNSFSGEEKTNASRQAVQEMLDGGIVAVGDIANTTDTLDLRAQYPLHWHTFIESIGFAPERADASFAYALNTWQAFAEQEAQDKLLLQSIVPHAPYSVSEPLFRHIAQHRPGATLSVHNQETADENHYYHNKSGGFTAFLQQIGIDDGSFLPSGKSSLQTYAEWLSADNPLMLVHNTFSAQEDLVFAQGKFPQLYWCICANANWYIEHRLPDIPLLDRMGAVLCVGTDSLASNHRLSVWAELQTINEGFPEIGWEKLLRWATYNGACALQMEEQIGSFEAGKQPGILQLYNNRVKRLY